MSLNNEQPAPTPNNQTPVWELVIKDMMERNEIGIKRYNMPLQAFNGRDALVDVYQELLDASVYIRQRIEEEKTLENCYKQSEKAADECIDDLHVKLKTLREAAEPFRRFSQSGMFLVCNTVTVPSSLVEALIRAVDKTIDMCSHCEVPYVKCGC